MFSRFSVLLTFILSVIVAQAAPPNDNFAAAQTLSVASGSVNSTNADGTREADEERHTDYPFTVHSTVWFSWTAPDSKPTSFEITAQTELIIRQ